MDGTLRTNYKGWDITVRCLKFRARANTHGQPSFTASGRAVLGDAANDGEWTDARPQVVTLGGRIFDTTTTCTQVLVAEIQVMIDALKRTQDTRRTF